jgi:hypothetical protein
MNTKFKLGDFVYADGLEQEDQKNTWCLGKVVQIKLNHEGLFYTIALGGRERSDILYKEESLTLLKKVTE